MCPSYFNEIETILDKQNKLKGFLYRFSGKSNMQYLNEKL